MLLEVVVLWGPIGQKLAVFTKELLCKLARGVAVCCLAPRWVLQVQLNQAISIWLGDQGLFLVLVTRPHKLERTVHVGHGLGRRDLARGSCLRRRSHTGQLTSLQKLMIWLLRRVFTARINVVVSTELGVRHILLEDLSVLYFLEVVDEGQTVSLAVGRTHPVLGG